MRRVGGRVRGGIAAVTGLGLLAACGTIGPPVAPEDIGITAAVQKQKEREEKERGTQGEKPAPAQEPTAESAQPEPAGPEAAGPGEDVILPPLRPVGTR